MCFDCNNCEYLNITEEQQNEYFQKTGTKPSHICRKYNKRVYHEVFLRDQPHHRIHPCAECKEDKANEI